MDDFRLAFDVRDLVLCLTLLAAMVAAGVAVVRHKQSAGFAAIASFVILAIDPIVELIMFRALNLGTAGANWAYACISSVTNLVGLGLMVVALYLAARPQPAEAKPPM